MTTTAYLDLFLRSISEPALLQTFLSFILLHTHDNVYVLDTLVSRVNTPFQVNSIQQNNIIITRSHILKMLMRCVSTAGDGVSGSVQDSHRSVL